MDANYVSWPWHISSFWPRNGSRGQRAGGPAHKIHDISAVIIITTAYLIHLLLLKKENNSVSVLGSPTWTNWPSFALRRPKPLGRRALCADQNCGNQSEKMKCVVWRCPGLHIYLFIPTPCALLQPPICSFALFSVQAHVVFSNHPVDATESEPWPSRL